MSNFPLFGSFALLLKQKSNKSRGPLFQHSAVAIFKPDDFASSWSSPDFASSWILLPGSLAITWGRQQESDRCGQPVIKQFQSAQSAQAISAQFCTILQLVIFAQFLQILSDTFFTTIGFSGMITNYDLIVSGKNKRNCNLSKHFILATLGKSNAQ